MHFLNNDLDLVNSNDNIIVIYLSPQLHFDKIYCPLISRIHEADIDTYHLPMLHYSEDCRQSQQPLVLTKIT